MGKKEILISIGILVFLILIPTICFLIIFSGSQISNDIAKWGSFGDYFGGILNSIFSLLSLFVTIYIAVKISKIEENRNNTNLKFEKEKLLREFREAEYKRINIELQKVWSSLTEHDREKAMKLIHDVIWQYRYFTTSNFHLFPFLIDSEISNLKQSLVKVSKLFNENSKENTELVISEFIKALDAFNVKFQNFLLHN